MLTKIKEFLFGKKSPVETMTIRNVFNENYPDCNGWYLFKGAVAYAGPYRREKDAKGQLTRLRKGYTPAARKV